MAEFVKVAEVGQLPPGEMLLVLAGDVEAVLVNIDGGYYAFAPSCTHSEGALIDGMVDGACITCPLHGSEFDVRTGEVLSGPATEPVPTYPVRVEGNDISIEVG